MSSNLKWRPIGDRRDVADYDVRLKDALREEFGRGNRGGPILLDSDALPFLRGLKAARVSGAAVLMDLIEKHERIEVWEES